MKTAFLAALFCATAHLSAQEPDAPAAPKDNAQTEKGTFQELGHFSVITGEAGQKRFYDYQAGAQWKALSDEIAATCKRPNGMTDPRCRAATRERYRSEGKLRGAGYCEKHWADKSASDLAKLVEILKEAASQAKELSPLQRIDRTEGEIFFGDFDLELRCALNLSKSTPHTPGEGG